MSASPESLSRMRRKAGSVTPPRPGSGRTGGSRRSRRCWPPARCAAPRSSCDSCLSAFTCFWSSRTTSSSHLFRRPSTIFSWTFSGLPSAAACSRSTRSSASLASSGTSSSRHVLRRSAAATCRATSRANSWNSLGAGHEVGLAVHLDQHADLAAGVDVARHDALAWPRARRAWRPRPGPSRAGSRSPCPRRRRPPGAPTCSP